MRTIIYVIMDDRGTYFYARGNDMDNAVLMETAPKGWRLLYRVNVRLKTADARRAEQVLRLMEGREW